MTEIKAPAENDLEEAKEKPNVLQMALLNNPGSGAISLANIAGTCLTSEAARMKRIIFRATRGLALTFFHDIKEPLIMSNGWEEFKSVFIVLYQDTESISRKLKLVCDAFCNQKMEIPTSGVWERIGQIAGEIERIADLERISKQEIERSYKTLNDLSFVNISCIELLWWLMKQEQNIYSTLNKFKMGDRIFRGLFWVPHSRF